MNLVAFVAGLVFAAGLCVAGMTQPSKVLGFLDFTGKWDPALAFVMVGAIGVSAVAYRIAARRSATFLGERFHFHGAARAVRPRLLVGAALFGVGWGLSGLCPGPAIVSLAGAEPGILVFLAAMIVGIVVANRVDRRARAEIRSYEADKPSLNEMDGAK